MKFIYVNKVLTEIYTERQNDSDVMYEKVSQGRIRSLEQNALYWKCIEIIANESGYSKDELHVYFKYSFIAVPTFRLSGRDLNTYDIGTFTHLYSTIQDLQLLMAKFTTTILNSSEFTEYIKQVQEFAYNNYSIEF